MLMTNVKRIFLIVALLNITHLYADFTTGLELRGAAFIPTNDRMRDIYGGALGDVQVELSANSECNWGAWANVDFATKHGCSLGLKKSTKISLVDFSFGVRYLFDTCYCFRPALGFGVNVGHVKLKNCTDCSAQCISDTNGGFVLKSNLYYDISDCWFTDLFVDYRFQRFCFTDKVNVGGFLIGLGIGMYF